MEFIIETRKLSRISFLEKYCMLSRNKNTQNNIGNTKNIRKKARIAQYTAKQSFILAINSRAEAKKCDNTVLLI